MRRTWACLGRGVWNPGGPQGQRTRNRVGPWEPWVQARVKGLGDEATTLWTPVDLDFVTTCGQPMQCIPYMSHRESGGY